MPLEFSPYPGFCDGAYRQFDARLVLSVDAAFNIFPHSNEQGVGKPGKGMISRPGMETFSTGTPGTGRCLYAGEERMFKIVADELFEVDDVGTETLLGLIGIGTNPCTILQNPTQIMVINPNTGAVTVSGARVITGFADAGGLVEVTFAGTAPPTATPVVFSGTGLAIDGSRVVTNTGLNTVTVDGSTWPGGSPPAQGFASFLAPVNFTDSTAIDAVMGFFLDGYGFVVKRDTNEIYQSAPLDFTVWDPILTGTFIAASDRLQQTVQWGDGAWLIGSSTAQYVTNSGASGFVLAKVSNSMVQMGTRSPYSPSDVSGNLCMIGSSKKGFGGVGFLRPGRFDKISNYAVDQDLVALGDLTGVTGGAQEWEGHLFYVIDIPGVKQWWYDFTEKTWHIRVTSGAVAGYAAPLGRFPVSVFAGGYYFQNGTTGTVYKQRASGGSLKKDDTVIFRAQRTAPQLYNGDRFNINAFRVDMLADADPAEAASMRYSVDGGLNYTGSYVAETMGRNGETGVLEWPQLGQAGNRGLVVDVVWDGEHSVAVAGARVSATPGMA